MAETILGKGTFVPRGEHDSTISYERLNLVTDANYTGIYVAKKNVPSGTELSNEEYWMKVVSSLTIGEVETVTATEGASAEIVIDSETGLPTLNLSIPRGVAGNESLDDTAGEGDTDKVWSADKLSKLFDADKTVTIDRTAFISTKNKVTFLANHYLTKTVSNTTSNYTVYDETTSAMALPESTNYLYCEFDYDVLEHPEDYVGKKQIKVYFKDENKSNISTQDLLLPKQYIYIPEGTAYIGVAFMLMGGRTSYGYTETIRVNKLQICEAVKIDDDLLSRFLKKTKVHEFDFTSAQVSSSATTVAIPYPTAVKPNTTYVAKFDSMTSNQEYNSLYLRLNEYDASALVVRDVLSASATGNRIVFTTSPTTLRIIPSISYSSSLSNNVFTIEGFELYELTDEYEFILADDVSVSGKSVISNIDNRIANYIIPTRKVNVESYTTPSYGASESRGVSFGDGYKIPAKPRMKYIVRFDSLTSTATTSSLSFKINETTEAETIGARHMIPADGEKEVSFVTGADVASIEYFIQYSSSTSGTYTVEGFEIYEFSADYDYMLADDVYVEANNIPEISGAGDINTFGSNNSLFIKSLLPEHWKSDNYLEGIRDKVRDTHADVRFTFITDCHYCYFESHNSVRLMQYFNDMFHIHHTFDGGDILGSQNNTRTHAEAMAKLNLWADQLMDVMGENYHYIFGNHDQNKSHIAEDATEEEIIESTATYQDDYKALIGPFKRNKVFEDTTIPKTSDLYYWNRMHYYVDDPVQKMRYIVMCTGTPSEMLYEDVYSGNRETYAQLNWLYKTLMSTPSGYSVITFGHQFFTSHMLMYLAEEGLPPNPDYVMYEHVTPIARMMIGAGKKLIIDTGGDTDYYDKGNVQSSYDFTNAPDITPICLWCGHTHIDGNWVYDMDDDSITYSADCPHGPDDNKILMLLTTCDTANGHSTYNQYLPPRVVGTRTEHAFDIVSIDKGERTIHCTRVGFGNDRTMTY